MPAPPALPTPPAGFTAPHFLVLLLTLPLIYWIARRARLQRRAGSRAASLPLRLGAATLVVLALAGLRLPATPRAVATVFLVDMSDSVPASLREEAKEWVRQALREAGPDDLAGIVTFGRDARV